MRKKKLNKKSVAIKSVNMPNKKRFWLIAIGISLLLAIGAMSEQSKNNFLSTVAEKVGLKESKSATTSQPTNPLTGPLQLSKEYVYAGSRTLSVEDYGVVPANPSPTPATASGGGGNPTPTPTVTLTPTPTPTPTPASFTVTLSVNPSSLFAENDVEVSWTGSQPRPTSDSLVIFRVTTLFPEVEEQDIAEQNITGGTIGMTSIYMDTPGNYRIKYFVQGNPNPIATSGLILVKQPQN